MHKAIRRISLSISNGFYPIFAILAALFLCGAVVGNTAADSVSFLGQNVLSQYINNYIDVQNAVVTTNPNFYSCLLNNFIYQLAVWILGFTGFGIFVIPVVISVKGFFLSFAVSSFIHILGTKGLWAALIVFGLGDFIALPCFLFISIQSFSSSLILFNISRGKKGNYSRIFDKYFFFKKWYLLYDFAFLHAA